MYAPSVFKVHHAIALKFAAARGFGLVVACGGGRQIAARMVALRPHLSYE
jgi:predicted FMN-binding regulatory protein PaiB